MVESFLVISEIATMWQKTDSGTAVYKAPSPSEDTDTLSDATDISSLNIPLL